MSQIIVILVLNFVNMHLHFIIYIQFRELLKHSDMSTTLNILSLKSLYLIQISDCFYIETSLNVFYYTT